MRRSLSLVLLGLLGLLGLLSACGGGTATEPASSPTEKTSTDEQPLVGTWTYEGHVPAVISVKLTFDASNAFTMVETVAPASTPAGVGPTTCVTTDTYLGTYVVNGSAVDLTFTGGTANAVAGCESASGGSPMTQDAIAAYRAQGMVPASSDHYSVTSTTLELTPTPSDPLHGGLANNATIFTKAD